MADLPSNQAETNVVIVDRTTGNAAEVNASNQLKVISTLSGITGSIKSSVVTITTTATAIPTTALTGRNNLTIFNAGPSDMYIGASNVTTANGFIVAKNSSISLDVSDNVIVYGIVSVGTSDTRILETS